ncbi:MAG TPA: FAD-dependent oxidoreductase [Xanthobacteraceae bacterium]|nr:FAD-dependent oxidoreductase [Xanthobacteraceae bacterium]
MGFRRGCPRVGGRLTDSTFQGRVPFFVGRVSEAIEPCQPRNFVVVILGGGNAGMGVTVPTREAGVRVAIIEPDLLGGTCPNRGCMPKKVLVAAAHALARKRITSPSVSQPSIGQR